MHFWGTLEIKNKLILGQWLTEIVFILREKLQIQVQIFSCIQHTVNIVGRLCYLPFDFFKIGFELHSCIRELQHFLKFCKMCSPLSPLLSNKNTVLILNLIKLILLLLYSKIQSMYYPEEFHWVQCIFSLELVWLKQVLAGQILHLFTSAH